MKCPQNEQIVQGPYANFVILRTYHGISFKLLTQLFGTQKCLQIGCFLVQWPDRQTCLPVCEAGNLYRFVVKLRDLFVTENMAKNSHKWLANCPKWSEWPRSGYFNHFGPFASHL